MFPSQQECSLHQHGYPDFHQPLVMHMQPVKIGDTYTKINNIKQVICSIVKGFFKMKQIENKK